MTYLFAHKDVTHLLSNLICQLLMSLFMENNWTCIRTDSPVSKRTIYWSIYCHAKTTLIYLGSGIFGAFLYGAKYPDNKLIGASGAVFGIMGINFVNASFLIIQYAKNVESFDEKSGLLIFIFNLIKLLICLGLIIYSAIAYTLGDEKAPSHYIHLWGFVIGLGIAFVINTFELCFWHCNDKSNEEYQYKDNQLREILRNNDQDLETLELNDI